MNPSERLKELQQKHTAAVARAEREIALVPLLPLAPEGICAHDGSNLTVSVTFVRKTLAEALEVYRAFLPSIVDAEAWKSGCVSVHPAEINRYAKDEFAKLQFTAHASIDLTGFGHPNQRFYQQTELEFFSRIGGEWLRVSVRIDRSPFPVSVWFDQHSREWRHSFPTMGADSVLGWWSEKPAYHKSYYWADTHNFLASMSQVKEGAA